MVPGAKEDVSKACGEAVQHRLQGLQTVADVSRDDDGICLEGRLRQPFAPARNSAVMSY